MIYIYFEYQLLLACYCNIQIQKSEANKNNTINKAQLKYKKLLAYLLSTILGLLSNIRKICLNIYLSIGKILIIICYLAILMKSPASYHPLDLSYEDFAKMKRNISYSQIANYQICQKLGEGGFGQVYKGFNKKTASSVAVKVIDLFMIKQEKNQALKEIKLRLSKNQDKIMQMCDSPYLVKCYDVYENQDLKIIIMQYCNKGTLQEHISNKKKIPEQQAILILKQILNGIAELHSHNIVHRDLKSENILLHNNFFKIADFGFSKKLDTEGVTSLGTLPLMAPEILARKRYGLKADIWSVGVIFFQMLFGQYPYQKTNKLDIIEEIQKSDLMKKETLVYKGISMSKQVYDFIKLILVIDPEKRIGWKQLIRHPIFNEKKNESKISRFLYNDGPVLMPTNGDEILNLQNPEEMQFPSGFRRESQMVKLVKKMSTQIPKKPQVIQCEEDTAFKWMDTKLNQCLKSQLIFQEIVQKIQKHQLLDLQKRETIQLMYLLTARCFLDLSPIHNEMSKLRKKFVTYTHIYEAVQNLYLRLKKRWQYYQKVLTDTQNQILNRIADFVASKENIERKNKYMNGIDNIDYQKKDQLKFIQKQYISILSKKIPLTPQSKKVREYLTWYKEINLVSPEAFKKEGFDRYIELVIQGS